MELKQLSKMNGVEILNSLTSEIITLKQEAQDRELRIMQRTLDEDKAKEELSKIHDLLTYAKHKGETHITVEELWNLL